MRRMARQVLGLVCSGWLGWGKAAVVFLVFPFLFMDAARAATHVQQASKSDVSGRGYTSFSVTLGSATTPGNAILIGVTYGNINPSITASDSQGNVYALAIKTYDSGHRQGCAVLYALNIRGGAANQVTIKFGGSVAYLAVGVHEYSGIAPSAALDVAAGRTGNGVNPTSGNAATKAGGDLIFGSGVEDSTGNGVLFSAAGGFTKRVDMGGQAGYADEDGVQTSAGPVSAGWTVSPGGSWISVMAAFKCQTAAPASVAAPSIASLSPNSGPAGTSVTLSGANFGGTQGSSTVQFNGAVATPASWSSTAIVTQVPAGATTGSVVVTVGGVASNAMTFAVTPPPPPPPPGSAPAFVNGQRQVNTYLGVGNFTSAGCNNNSGAFPYHFCLADPSLPGNAILAACTWSGGSGPTATVTDDMNQLYTAAFLIPPADGDQNIQIWYVTNSAPGVHQLSLDFGAGKPSGIQCGAYQVQNIAAVAPDCGTTSASGTGTSVAAGSFTPQAPGCFIFQLAVEDTGWPSGRWIAGGGFTLQDASTREGWAVQTLADFNANPVNPTLTMSSANAWLTAAVALQPASAGTAPSGMFVTHISQNSLMDGKSSYTFQFPCSGNLVVVAFNGNTGESLISVTGANPTVAYQQVGSGVVGVEGIQQIWQSPDNMTCSQDHMITINSSGPINAGDVMFYDVIGAAGSRASDSALATSAGNQSPFSSPLAGPAVTPGSTDGIVFCTIGIALNGSNSFNPAGFQDNQDENNGWGHFHYASAGILSTSWGTDTRQGGGGTGYYSAACAAFKSAP